MDSTSYASMGANNVATQTFTGIDSGTTTVTAYFGTFQRYIWDGVDCYDFNEIYDVIGTGGVEVRPIITSITPSRGGVGSVTRVTIAGRGFIYAPTVNAGSGISISLVSFSNTQIVADFTIDSNATGGNRNVTVFGSGITSNAVNFFVQIPKQVSQSFVT